MTVVDPGTELLLEKEHLLPLLLLLPPHPRVEMASGKIVPKDGF